MRFSQLSGIVMFLVCILTTKAQNPVEGRFFFRNFQDTYVYYKDGRTFIVPANYDLVNGSFVFIDTEDGNQLKLFGEQNNIGSIRVNDRVFLATSPGPTEIIRTDPEFMVLYKPHILDGAKPTGYGGASSASATRTVSHIQGAGPVQYLQKEENYVKDISKVYTIKVGNKKRQFETEKQFLKIFSGHTEQLKQYIADKQIDFNSIIQVEQLCNYALSLCTK